MPLIPPERLIDWTPGTYTGVIGGIPTDRTSFHNVMDFGASGSDATTTGSIDSGSPTLTVASAATFEVGQNVHVGKPSIQTLTITHAATGTANVYVYLQRVLKTDPGDLDTILIAVTDGDSINTVAGKVRSGTFPDYVTVGGAGADIIFTYTNTGPQANGQINGAVSGDTGVTGSFASTQTGVTVVQSSEIIDITGTTITLEDNASGTVTGATVSHDDQPAIQEAITEQFIDPLEGVYIPAGTYRLYGSLSFNNGFDNASFIGDPPINGVHQTVLKDYYGAPIIFGQSGFMSDLGLTFAEQTITAGSTEGSTEITINGATTNVVVGRCILIQFQNDNDYPNFNVGASDVFSRTAPVRQAVRVTAKGANTITFTPPLFETRAGTAIVQMFPFQITGGGMENFKVDCSNATALRAIYTQLCYGCWIYDVEIIKAANYGVVAENTVNCEYRKVWVHEGKLGGTNGAGLLASFWSCLIVDSIFEETFPVIEINNGSAGNAIAYNYSPEAGVANTNHGPFNRFNVYEGNAFGYMISDGYFGGEGTQTMIRCYFHSNLVAGSINLRRGSRDFSMVGNICAQSIGVDGFPNIGNVDFLGTVDTSIGDYWKDWDMTGTLTTRSSDTSGVITLDSGDLYFSAFTPHPFTIYWGSAPLSSTTCLVTAYDDVTKEADFTSSGTLPAEDTALTVGPGSFFPDVDDGTFQEKDLTVAATSIDKGNYTIYNDTTSSTGGDSVPDSYLYEEKPSWFFGLDWPPFIYTNPGTADVNNIPAGYRATHNGENPPGPGSGSVAFDGSGSTTFTGAGSVTFG